MDAEIVVSSCSFQPIKSIADPVCILIAARHTDIHDGLPGRVVKQPVVE